MLPEKKVSEFRILEEIYCVLSNVQNLKYKSLYTYINVTIIFISLFYLFVYFWVVSLRQVNKSFRHLNFVNILKS